MPDQILITPETKVGALLDAYPELEQVLIELAPAFKKLQNPILRKTISKVATLRQVAQIGDVNLGSLINTLRSKVGMAPAEIASETEGLDHSTPPEWLDAKRITQRLDARPIIEAGEQPINRVMNELKDLKENEIYELITPFVPAPLIDLAKKQGFRSWSQQVDGNAFHTFFSR
ncbi:MAG: DUF1858 domain-containing protein [candidate division KSB1 bacterium]|nr:DUF1858 domain-containing protein [candidate division KSB1 bacterium]MDZ7400272.1 DUF1858 domain-containing protein [candidate division KSB1 bacterium]